MALEIERKFLVKNTSFIKDSFKKVTIKQGFLNSDKNRVVRIRVTENKAFITIKGISNDSGTIRKEWEYEIDRTEAEQLLTICEPTIIEKIRYYFKCGSHVFEVDVFEKENQGLIIAEIELTSEKEFFEKPSWLGEEVTGNIKYYNSYLSQHPFNSWA